mgnify:CR=1 FL=1
MLLEIGPAQVIPAIGLLGVTLGLLLLFWDWSLATARRLLAAKPQTVRQRVDESQPR